MSEQKKSTDNCYSIEDENQALNCFKELVAEATPPCPPKLVLLTQEDCTPCEKQRQVHKQDILDGLIQEVSVSTSKGQDIARKNELLFLPALVLLDCRDKLIFPSG